MKKISSCLFLIPALGLLSACSTTATYVESTIFAFDTTCSIRLYNAEQAQADAISNQFAYLSRLFDADNDSSTSTYNTVYTLNQKMGMVELPDEVIEILEYGVKMQSETDGYFNIFTYNLNTEYKAIINAKENQKEKLDKLMEKMPDYLSDIASTHLSIDGNKALLEGKERIDLGGLAKGYALKWAKAYLESEKIEAYLINMGHSSIGLGKTSKEGKSWTVNLYDGDETAASFELKQTTLGVSGSGEQNVEIEGKTYSHIINPKTGEAEAIYHLTASIGDDPLLNDVLSTTFYLLDRDEVNSLNLKYGVSYFLFDGETITCSSDLKVSSKWPTF